MTNCAVARPIFPNTHRLRSPGSTQLQTNSFPPSRSFSPSQDYHRTLLVMPDSVSIIPDSVRVAHQRNGITGRPFYYLTFQFIEDNKTFDAVAFVCNDWENDQAYGVITPGHFNHNWRGDHFIDELASFIKESNAKADAKFMAEAHRRLTEN